MFEAQALSCDDFLGGRVKILQPINGYRAATDPVFLAAACPAKPNDAVLELGCGSGTASLCLAARVPVRLTGVERLPEYADLARRNATANLANMTVVDADLSNMPLSVRDTIFDHVILNPPYYRNGRRASDQGRAQGRQEETPLAEWLDQGLRRLRPKGTLSIIHLTERLSDILFALNNRAGTIKILPLSARSNQNAKRVIVLAIKGGAGGTTLHNPLILHEGSHHTEDADSYTPAAKRILQNVQPIVF